MRTDIEDKINEIAEKYIQGMSLRELGCEYNVSYSTIRRRLVKHGIQMRLHNYPLWALATNDARLQQVLAEEGDFN